MDTGQTQPLHHTPSIPTDALEVDPQIAVQMGPPEGTRSQIEITDHSTARLDVSHALDSPDYNGDASIERIQMPAPLLQPDVANVKHQDRTLDQLTNETTGLAPNDVAHVHDLVSSIIRPDGSRASTQQ